ncbi:MAG TPA: hypothetical protein VJU82_13070 [Acidobacteriaceae bacterium]|nr:hypothetical protein [Acidobacteriaceae bacterium]
MSGSDTRSPPERFVDGDPDEGVDGSEFAEPVNDAGDQLGVEVVLGESLDQLGSGGVPVVAREQDLLRTE